MSGAGAVEWTAFAVVVAALLAIDFAYASRGPRERSVRAAWLWTGVWIALAAAFGGWIALRLGKEVGVSYLTAYLVEKSLSIDNLALFALVFSQTGIQPPLQRRVLLWGVLSALVMRAILIASGLYLLERFHWLVYPFSALLLYAAARMFRSEARRERWAETTCALCTSWVSRFVPITPEQQGDRFVVRIDGKRHATPLLVALVAIESADLVFAVDSIPAVFAVTQDPFLIYTSNVFALLGLRALYTVIGNVLERFPYLRFGLAALLVFVALKLGLSGWIHIPPGASLAVIAAILGIALAASRLLPPPAPTNRARVQCAHRDQIREVQAADTGCTECKALGESWVQLRMCMTCGQVGCCDSSKNRHATAHFHNSGHAIMQSLERGDRWKWCYVDRAVID